MKEVSKKSSEEGFFGEKSQSLPSVETRKSDIRDFDMQCNLLIEEPPTCAIRCFKEYSARQGNIKRSTQLKRCSSPVLPHKDVQGNVQDGERLIIFKNRGRRNNGLSEKVQSKNKIKNECDEEEFYTKQTDLQNGKWSKNIVQDDLENGDEDLIPKSLTLESDLNENEKCEKNLSKNELKSVCRNSEATSNGKSEKNRTDFFPESTGEFARECSEQKSIKCEGNIPHPSVSEMFPSKDITKVENSATFSTCGPSDQIITKAENPVTFLSCGPSDQKWPVYGKINISIKAYVSRDVDDLD